MTSHPEFGRSTTATEVAEVFADQIRGKNVIITGVSPKSLGAAMAMAIAGQDPAHLFLASRTLEKVEKVAQAVKQVFSFANVEVVSLDLSSQESIKEAARKITEKVDTIDVLINNAGVMVLQQKLTAEGIELQFGTNHIGHYLLTHLLMDPLKKAAQGKPGAARVINVTSEGHRLSPIRFHDYNIDGNKDIPPEEQPPPTIRDAYQGNKGYNGWLAYGQSKTANILFSLYLSEQLKSQGIVSYAVHPGSIWTDLSRNLDEKGNQVIASTSTYWKSDDQGAATMLVAAFDPALSVVSEPTNIFLSDCQFTKAAPHALDFKVAERLNELSTELTRSSHPL